MNKLMSLEKRRVAVYFSVGLHKPAKKHEVDLSGSGTSFNS